VFDPDLADDTPAADDLLMGVVGGAVDRAGHPSVDLVQQLAAVALTVST
jgi:hypothetical protein